MLALPRGEVIFPRQTPTHVSKRMDKVRGPLAIPRAWICFAITGYRLQW